MGPVALKRGTYMLRFASVMVSSANADQTFGDIAVRTCLAADCATNTIIDDYKMVADAIDYAKLSYTATADPKIKV